MTNVIDPRFKSNLAPELYERLIKGNPPKIGPDGSIYTGAVRLSWPVLVEPRLAKQSKPDDKPKYSAVAVFTHKNVDVINEALYAAMRKYYPGIENPAAVFNPLNNKGPGMKDQGFRVALKDGGLDPIGKTTPGYVPGYMYISAKNVNRVHCFRMATSGVSAVFPEDIAPVMYPGCWVTMKIRLYPPKDMKTNPGVFFSLESIMKLADDMAFGGSGEPPKPGDFEGAVAIEDPNENAILQSSQVTTAEWD